MAHFEQWAGFKGKEWVNSVDVRSFIQENYTPYEGDESFLEGPTEATDILWGKLQELQKEERAKGGVLDMETEVVTWLPLLEKLSRALNLHRKEQDIVHLKNLLHRRSRHGLFFRREVRLHHRGEEFHG